MTARIFYDADASLDRIKDKAVAIIGYGSQGHAHALNLKDSGIDVRVGLPKNSRSVKKACDAGLRVTTPREAARESDITMVLVPDTAQSDLFEHEIGSEM